MYDTAVAILMMVLLLPYLSLIDVYAYMICLVCVFIVMCILRAVLRVSLRLPVMVWLPCMMRMYNATGMYACIADVAVVDGDVANGLCVGMCGVVAVAADVGMCICGDVYVDVYYYVAVEYDIAAFRVSRYSYCWCGR